MAENPYESPAATGEPVTVDPDQWSWVAPTLISGFLLIVLALMANEFITWAR